MMPNRNSSLGRPAKLIVDGKSVTIYSGTATLTFGVVTIETKPGVVMSDGDLPDDDKLRLIVHGVLKCGEN